MPAGMIERSLAEFESAVTASELTEKGIAEKVEAFAAGQEQATAVDLWHWTVDWIADSDFDEFVVVEQMKLSAEPEVENHSTVHSSHANAVMALLG